MRAMAAIDSNGMPLLLAKATKTVSHGGGQRFTVDSNQAVAFRTFLGAVSFDTGCQASVTQAKVASVQQLSDADTLRKAALQLAGRLPTAAELQMVTNGNLDGALSSLFAAPGFGDYVMRVFDDIFLNVGSKRQQRGYRHLQLQQLHRTGLLRFGAAEQWPTRVPRLPGVLVRQQRTLGCAGHR